MLIAIWLLIVGLSLVFGVFDHRLHQVLASILTSAGFTLKLSLGLCALIVFWSGVINVAQDAGLAERFSRLVRPIISRLFPDVPTDHPAFASICLNIAANMLGLSNAATPIGLRAMSYLSELNNGSKKASHAMCMLLTINTSSVQILPITAIAMLAAGGATHPTDIVLTSLLATTCSTIAGISAAKLFRKIGELVKRYEPGQTQQ